MQPHHFTRLFWSDVGWGRARRGFFGLVERRSLSLLLSSCFGSAALLIRVCMQLIMYPGSTFAVPFKKKIGNYRWRNLWGKKGKTNHH